LTTINQRLKKNKVIISDVIARVKGQHNPCLVLRQIITSGRLPSAFLFWGEEGLERN